jgi:hypothetical protein
MKVFFILGMGRSGTKWIADILNTAKNARVIHEGVASDDFAYLMAFENPEGARGYFRKFRFRHTSAKINLAVADGLDVYGESNGILRRHAGAIKRFIPDAELFHLIRDPRLVIPSIVSRRAFTKKSIATYGLYSSVPGWKRLSRFEKICHLWTEDNKFLRKHIGHRNRLIFEKLVTDFDYFKNLCDRLEIKIPRSRWKRFKRKKINSLKSSGYKSRMNPFPDWSSAKLVQFDLICGKERREYYEP